MSYEGWNNGIPPWEWERTLAIDVGGSSPWGWLWTAIDPQNYVVAYHQIYKATTNVDDLVNQAMPWMSTPDGKPLKFRFKACDYENKVAMEDIRRRGILVTNAVKHNKAASVHRVASYLHPNPKRPFPQWHPKAGQLGSPLLFIVNCPDLVKELPQQKWKESAGRMRDEPDDSIADHLVDCLLYTCRLLPDPTQIKTEVPETKQQLSLQSRMYYADVKRHQDQLAAAGGRRPYHASHSR